MEVDRGDAEVGRVNARLRVKDRHRRAAATVSTAAMNVTFETRRDSPEDDEVTQRLLPSSPGSPQEMSSTRERRLRQLLRGDSLQQLLQADSFRSAQEAIRRLGHYLAYFTLIAMFILVPIALYNALNDRKGKLDQAAYNSAWIMVCGTIIISVRLVYLHLTHWYMPEVQKYVVRILWMVPIYATQSYLSLRYHHARLYIDTIRDFYEAYVIASFVYYLMALLGGQDSLVEILRNKADTNLGQHTFPLSLILQPWELGLEFALQCKHDVLQYVVFKTMSTFLIFICASVGVYGEGKFDWFSAYPYLCFFQNLSVMYALYCLVMLFHAVEAELRHPINWRPLGKFLCVKGVVFFSWWQGVVIYYLRAHGIITHLGSWTSEEVANGLTNYAICVEMIGFAIAHSYTFTYKEYLPGNLPPASSFPGAVHDVGNAEESSGVVVSAPTTTTLPTSPANRVNTYRPPATLPERMKFKDAFWSSTVPKETIQDIQRLRTGVDLARSTSDQSIQRAAAITLTDMAMRKGSNHTDEIESGNESENGTTDGVAAAPTRAAAFMLADAEAATDATTDGGRQPIEHAVDSTLTDTVPSMAAAITLTDAVAANEVDEESSSQPTSLSVATHEAPPPS